MYSLINRRDEMNTKYRNTHEIFGDEYEATIEEYQGMLNDWEADGWNYTLEASGNELRVYAERTEDFDWDAPDNYHSTPNEYVSWTMITSATGYIVIGEEVEQIVGQPVVPTDGTNPLRGLNLMIWVVAVALVLVML
jgi:hypothetical protein